MGTEGAWIPLVMAAVGAGVSVYNSNRAAKKQDRALADSINNRAEASKKATDRTNELVDQLGEQSQGTSAQNLQKLYSMKLREGASATTNPLAVAGGNASERYAQDAAAASLGLSQNADTIANLASRIDAATDLRRQEADLTQRAGTDIEQIAAADRGAAFLDQLRFDRIRRNPWLDAASQFMTSYAGNYGGAGAAAGNSASKGGGNIKWGG